MISLLQPMSFDPKYVPELQSSDDSNKTTFLWPKGVPLWVEGN